MGSVFVPFPECCNETEDNFAMLSKSSRKGPFKSGPPIAETFSEPLETIRVIQTDADVITPGEKKSGRGKRKREEREKIKDLDDARRPSESKRSKKVKAEDVIESKSPSQLISKKARRSAKIELEEEEVTRKSGDSSEAIQEPSKDERKTNKIVKQEHADIDGEEAKNPAVEEAETPKKAKRKRKTKEEKEAEAMPIAVRTSGLRMFVGAHVSGAKGRSQRLVMALQGCI